MFSRSLNYELMMSVGGAGSFYVLDELIENCNEINV